MRNSTKLILPLIGATLVAFGCSKKDKEQVGFTSAFVTQSTWELECSDSDRFGLTMQSRFDIASGNFTKTNRYFSDGSCQDLSIESVEEGSVTYTSSDDSNGAIDFAYDTVQVTPKSDAGILALNAVTFCGSNTWTINETRDLTAFTGGESCWEKTPRTVHDIYQTSGQTIYFGAGSEREKGGSDTRPTALDQSRIWKIR